LIFLADTILGVIELVYRWGVGWALHGSSSLLSTGARHIWQSSIF